MELSIPAIVIDSSDPLPPRIFVRPSRPGQPRSAVRLKSLSEIFDGRESKVQVIDGRTRLGRLIHLWLHCSGGLWRSWSGGVSTGRVGWGRMVFFMLVVD